jgi:molybdopterin-guanine dinucleotide biosynthesis protein A
VTDHTITGIILAGGQSIRMGTDKGFMKIRGIPMIQHVIKVLKEFCPQLLINTGNKEYEQFGYPLIPDLFPIQAPIIGIYSGLMASKTAGNLVVSCDMPFIRREILKIILDRSRQSEMVVPVHPDGIIEPFCGYYCTSIGSVLHQQIEKGEFSLQGLKNLPTCRLIPFHDFGLSSPEKYFLSINTPEDLQ